MNTPSRPTGKKTPKAKARSLAAPRTQGKRAVAGISRRGTQPLLQLDAVGLDQFYTHPDLARVYAEEISARWPDPDTLFVEPSAGDGAFVQPLKAAGRKVRAMDIAPKARGIVRGDFFEQHELYRGRHSKIIVIGNPPFGKNASLATRFFNRAALDADGIAFIVPRTFRKMSLQARLNPHFHLVKDKNVMDYAFLIDGHMHDVPCAWQIWEHREKERKMPETPSVDHLIEYTKPAFADFAMRRVGFYAGRVIQENIAWLSLTTHYFLREVQEGVIDILDSIDWLEYTTQTAGSRSLSKREIAFKLGELGHAI